MKASGRFIPGIMLLLSALLLSGCLHSHTKFHGLEPTVEPLQKKKYEVLGDATSLVSNFSFFWVWTVTEEVDFDQAFREMISEKGGDDLINVRSWCEKQHWIVGTITTIHIKATVIRYLEE